MFSNECREILAGCDIVITNPPFSLWLKMYDYLKEYNRAFIVIGNILSVNYTNIFEDCKNLIYKTGYTKPSHFLKYAEYNNNNNNNNNDNEKAIIRVACYWFTNLKIDYKLRNFIKEKKPQEFRKLDNTNIINIAKIADLEYVPKDYDGEIAVPVTFGITYDPTTSPYEILGQVPKDICKIDGKSIFARWLIKKEIMKFKDWCYLNRFVKVKKLLKWGLSFPTDIKRQLEANKNSWVRIFVRFEKNTGELICFPLMNGDNKTVWLLSFDEVVIRWNLYQSDVLKSKKEKKNASQGRIN
ncbi:adenine-specific methyltransferase EcoRI family protein [Mycoplasma seminis]|uniref:Adenine-specific methyltransferase EcoRI family protein n=1 Tax=Mycoplasma seminis TaxID=512749 RepID=A0ABY9H9U6_9MOLU|nr:adenine-specific methyltransferase EcoRI family protein [Mycoplasma seminis]WLP85271.1 adenine-specific methyltransferase EcoRI family protein [Mycoplasma seminis]